jgi:hypothetical protein
MCRCNVPRLLVFCQRHQEHIIGAFFASFETRLFYGSLKQIPKFEIENEMKMESSFLKTVTELDMMSSRSTVEV